MSINQDQLESKNSNTFMTHAGSQNKMIVPFREAIFLFSVDQIREEESPWKVLSSISKTVRSPKKASPFKRRLQERKRLRMLYGNLSARALNRYLREIVRPDDLLQALESRLDITLKRSALFPSIQSARRSILQGGISVNHTIVRSPRYHCTPGDFIQVMQKSAFQGGSQQEKRSKSRKERIFCKVPPGKQNDCLVACPSFLELFLFSELSQSLGRKAGRLYGSTLSHIEGRQGKPLQCALEILERPVKESRTDNESFFLGRRGTSLTRRTLTQSSCKHPHSRVSHEQLNPNCLSKTLSINDKKTLKQETHIDRSTTGEPNESKQSLFQAVASRPLHLEVSYRSLCVIFLYPPQRIYVDVSIELSLLC